MFEDCFCNIVNIYPYQYDTSINTANHGGFDTDNFFENIKCKIRVSDAFNNTKIFFSPNITVKQGYGIYDLESDNFYTVTNVKKIFNLNKIHHITCLVTKSFEKADILNGFHSKNKFKFR